MADRPPSVRTDHVAGVDRDGFAVIGIDYGRPDAILVGGEADQLVAEQDPIGLSASGLRDEQWFEPALTEIAVPVGGCFGVFQLEVATAICAGAVEHPAVQRAVATEAGQPHHGAAVLPGSARTVNVIGEAVLTEYLHRPGIEQMRSWLLGRRGVPLHQ